ncbi:MAG: DUF5716 family protein [Clostridiales bacterium]|jgi:molecular chaperone DnaK (HSP70)|nr:DUF5716 family protein [Clostridiales bacterium]
MKNFDADFILGIDLGNDTSSISCFNARAGKPEAVDLSGGYGKPSAPTVLQYLRETSEWVFGEYAVQNEGADNEVLISDIIRNLENGERAAPYGESLGYAEILGVYIRELVKNVKTLNPNAAIAGIAAVAPSWAGERAKSDLRAAFKEAGLGDKLIGLVSDRQCILGRYYFDNYQKKAARSKIMTIDFGSREARAGVYEASITGAVVNINCTASHFDVNIGARAINDAARELFEKFYHLADGGTSARPTRQALDSFAYKHRDLLFQRALKPIRLYFNFTYPPTQYNMSARDIKDFVTPFEVQLTDFIETALKKAGFGSKEAALREIDDVICVGGGFEMDWAKKTARDFFGEKRVLFYKNAKVAAAEGASVVAAARLGTIENFKEIIIRDKNQLRADIGLKVRCLKNELFTPLAERNSFWWQERPPKYVILDEKTDAPVTITLWKRDAAGDVSRLKEITLQNLPKRPRGVTKLKIAARFDARDSMTLLAEDCGFGELFPKGSYSQRFTLNLDVNRDAPDLNA